MKIYTMIILFEILHVYNIVRQHSLCFRIRTTSCETEYLQDVTLGQGNKNITRALLHYQLHYILRLILKFCCLF